MTRRAAARAGRGRRCRSTSSPLGRVRDRWATGPAAVADARRNRLRVGRSRPAAVGEIVRTTRKACGMHQDELAGAAGVGSRFVVELEAGKPTAQLGKALRVLSALGCSVEITPPSDVIRLAEAVGLDVATVEPRVVCGRTFLLDERYDWFVGVDGHVRRIHQEDFCQALGIAPDNKSRWFGNASGRSPRQSTPRSRPLPRDRLTPIRPSSRKRTCAVDPAEGCSLHGERDQVALPTLPPPKG